MENVPTYLSVNQVDLLASKTGQGVPLVWGHGLMSSMASEDAADWFDWPTIADVATVIRYDARGHGQSGASAEINDYTWPNLAHDMLALAEQCKLASFVAGGMSMGCATALYAALQAPQRIQGLLLATPPTAWATRAAQAAVYEQMAGLVETRGTATLAAMMTQQAQTTIPALLQDAAPNLASQMAAELAKYDATTLATVLRGAKLSDFPPREQIQSITAPTLILAWAGDPSHPVATAEALQSLLPNAQTYIAHTVPELRQWPALIHDFLQQWAV